MKSIRLGPRATTILGAVFAIVVMVVLAKGFNLTRPPRSLGTQAALVTEIGFAASDYKAGTFVDARLTNGTMGRIEAPDLMTDLHNDQVICVHVSTRWFGNRVDLRRLPDGDCIRPDASAFDPSDSR